MVLPRRMTANPGYCILGTEVLLLRCCGALCSCIRVQHVSACVVRLHDYSRDTRIFGEAAIPLFAAMKTSDDS